ncbi:MAG: ATP-binding cassette domain-containing protein [Clostridia bacterium]
MSQPVIILEKVSKAYRHVSVLKNVDAQFERGMIHGIIGRNGSGKTLMLKAICGLMPVSSGIIRVNGKTIGINSTIPESIGAIIETPGFLPYYSGYKNLSYLASLKAKIGKSEIDAAIIRVGLDPKDRKWVGKYSLGMRQRLGIAQAIMEEPDILLLDEPFNGLDQQGIGEMRNLFSDLRSAGKTILIASHVQEDIDKLCDTVYEMDAGVLTRIR